MVTASFSLLERWLDIFTLLLLFGEMLYLNFVAIS